MQFYYGNQHDGLINVLFGKNLPKTSWIVCILAEFREFSKTDIATRK